MDKFFQVDGIATITALVGVIIWFIRLEGRIKAEETYSKLLGSLINEVKTKHDALDSKIFIELSQIRESLVRLETVFSMQKKGVSKPKK